jgi:hypothetical protein
MFRKVPDDCLKRIRLIEDDILSNTRQIHVYLPCPFNVLNWLRCPQNRLKIWPKIQRIKKNIRHLFHFFWFYQICLPKSDDTKIDQIDLCHIFMSYASYDILFHIMTYDILFHIMTYDTYDIEIWHKSNLLILVSKRPSGPQKSHPFIQFWLYNWIKLKKLR